MDTLIAHVLKTVDDIDSASRGVYVVESGTKAYYPVRGLIEEGQAELLGEFFDDGGNHVITVGLYGDGSAALRGFEDNKEQKRAIRIGQEFFITALKDYHDWQEKWWREAVQNAVDAGGRNVHLSAVDQTDGTKLVTCDDDGRGMDEDTIINKFLVLGATTKTSSSGSAGGFGKAKELLLLPWISWRIHSRDREVIGAGIDYEIREAPFRQGTRLEVVMPADKKTDHAIGMAFLQKCYLPHINFTVNDKPIVAELGGDRLISDIPGKIEIYFVPRDFKSHYMYIRTKGIYMFSIYIGEVPGVIIGEVIAPSIDILTANRDGFRDWETKQAIEGLAQRVAKDNMSALRAKQGLIQRKYEGTGRFRAKNKAADILENIGAAQTKLTNASEDMILKMLTTMQATDPDKTVVTSPIDASSMQAMLDIKYAGAAHVEAAIKQLVWQPDFYLVNTIENWVVPKRFFPETMKPRVIKLIKSWTELCRFVLMQLGSEAEFGVGFVFSEDTAAEARTDKNEKTGEEEHWLMVNPLRHPSKTKWSEDILSPSKENDLKWLYAAAIHECTHFADGLSYHDESFAAALTRNMARCADGYRKIKQIVAGIRTFGDVETDVE
jgi:hypothetical protein